MKVSPLTKTLVGLTAATAAGAAYVWVQKKRNDIFVEATKPVEVHGFVNSGYEAVAKHLPRIFPVMARLAQPAAFITRVRR